MKSYSILDAESVKSEEIIDEFLTENFDRRELVTFNRLEGLHDSFSGAIARGTSSVGFTKNQYKVLKVLTKNLKYKNMVMMDRKTLSVKLKVDSKSLIRELRKAGDCIKVVTKGLDVGQIKVFINPHIAYRYTKFGFSVALSDSARSWYSTGELQESIKSNSPFGIPVEYTEEHWEGLDEDFKDWMKSFKTQVAEKGTHLKL